MDLRFLFFSILLLLVRDKYLEDFAKTKDLHFYLGTSQQFHLIIGNTLLVKRFTFQQTKFQHGYVACKYFLLVCNYCFKSRFIILPSASSIVLSEAMAKSLSCVTAIMVWWNSWAIC